MIEDALRGAGADAGSLARTVPPDAEPAGPPRPVAAPTTPPRPTSPVRAWRIGESTPSPKPVETVSWRPPGDAGVPGLSTQVADISTFAEMKAARPVTPVPPPGAAYVPTARGTLGATPLAHVLVYMLDHALTGSIVFREPDELDHIVHFQHGAVSKVSIGPPDFRGIGDELCRKRARHACDRQRSQSTERAGSAFFSSVSISSATTS